VCDEYDIEDMVEKIKILKNDSVKFKEMSRQAVYFVNKNFSQKSIDSKWEMQYNNLSHGE